MTLRRLSTGMDLDAAHGDHPVTHEQFVGTGSARLYVRDVGHGLPIIVVHGGPDFDHEYLLPEMDQLARSFHLVYYDQRGRGRSFSGHAAIACRKPKRHSPNALYARRRRSSAKDAD